MTAERTAAVQACRDATAAYLRGDILRAEMRLARGEAYAVYADCSAESDGIAAKDAFDAVEDADKALASGGAA